MKVALKELVEKASRLGQKPINEEILPKLLSEKLKLLRRDGYVVLDHLVGSKEFAKLGGVVKELYEKRLNFNTPCLAQNYINETRHAELIKRNFKIGVEELDNHGLLFHQNDIQSYNQVIEDFGPSTLTIDMPSDTAFYNLWLDDNVIKIVSAYMGFVPIMREAFIRRNFPCKYPVMNHKWHRDTNHRLHLLKAFIFFTDCDLETGAHHYIPGSIGAQNFQENRYYDDEEVNEAFPLADGKQMISRVPAGTIIIEDTRGLHKAGIPKRGYRDLGFSVFLPHSFLHHGKPYFSIERKTYELLSPSQKPFIPSRSIVDS